MVLAIMAGHNTLLRSEANDSPAISACSQGTTGAQEGCTPSLLDTAPRIVLSHQILAGGCARGDLHVMRYTPVSSSAAPLTAAWCAPAAPGPG